MTRWPVTVAMEEEKAEVEEKKNMLTIRPGACLDGMAGQCPLGRPEATRGRLHHSTTGSTAPGTSTGVHTHTMTTSERHSRHQGEAGEVSSSVAAERRKPEWDSSHRSPRRGRGRQIDLVEEEEGAERISSPKVAAAELAGAGQNPQAAAAVTMVTGGGSRRES
jgi:hypothetical protein